MKQSSTLFLKLMLIFVGTAVLALGAFLLPEVANRDAAANPEAAHLQYPFLVYTYLGMVPFFMALYQAFKLLAYVDKNKAFSNASVKALRNIKYSGVGIITLIANGVVVVTFSVSGDRAHIIALGLFTIVVTTVITAFASLLEKLFQNAVTIKSENDLTV